MDGQFGTHRGAAVLVGVFSVSGVLIAQLFTHRLEQRKFTREASQRREKEVRELVC